jgi:hypothetical protein
MLNWFSHQGFDWHRKPRGSRKKGETAWRFPVTNNSAAEGHRKAKNKGFHLRRSYGGQGRLKWALSSEI